MTTKRAPAVHAKRVGPTLSPDLSRVLLRPFFPSSEDIARRIIARAMTLSEEEVVQLLENVLGEFEDRHEEVKQLLRKRFAQVRRYLTGPHELSEAREAFIGSYFTHEYSPEAAALFNPSIVPHPSQLDVPKGALRFILSLRATGEGHISSITFRTGIISARHRITLTPPVPFLVEPERVPNAAYEKSLFAMKLQEAGIYNEFCQRALERLPDPFAIEDLRHVLDALRHGMDAAEATAERSARGMLLLAESNYEVRFAPGRRVSQCVIFPVTSSQRNGIEDARFVRFQNGDGSFTYYATYTAYDGKIILPQLLETPDFMNFKFITLNGPAVQNKGIALFPWDPLESTCRHASLSIL